MRENRMWMDINSMVYMDPNLANVVSTVTTTYFTKCDLSRQLLLIWAFKTDL
jgi:hypothetical protein